MSISRGFCDATILSRGQCQTHALGWGHKACLQAEALAPFIVSRWDARVRTEPGQFCVLFYTFQKTEDTRSTGKQWQEKLETLTLWKKEGRGCWLAFKHCRAGLRECNFGFSTELLTKGSSLHITHSPLCNGLITDSRTAPSSSRSSPDGLINSKT